LGVSCTNNLDEDQAMQFLKSWLINNKKYTINNIPDNLTIAQMIETFK
jgi:hypothetical protein